jgi:hypothetical protein
MTGRKRDDVPARVLARLRSICLGLPESYEEKAWAGWRWMIRKRNFAHVVAIDGGWPPAYARAAGSDGPLIVVTFRVSGLLGDTLRTAGPPFFHAPWGTLWGTKVVGMVIGKGVDWDEVAVLLTESHRLLAPARLVAPPPSKASKPKPSKPKTPKPKTPKTPKPKTPAQRTRRHAGRRTTRR